MLCDSCKENEAIISYTKMSGNNVEEVHLCATCAEKKMKEDLTFNQAISSQVDSFLKELFKLTGNFDKEVIKKSCPNCGTTFDEFEKNHLGCESCYETFSSELSSMLNNLKYASKHKGKIPQSADAAISMRREEEELEDSLRKAIESEEYEKAAIIRDRIKEIRESK
ncbi:MAG: UvrB/UvrC motif-containing protein [Peptoniphilus sp.]|uniref:UvrB/UvrC motif-containing protein n=1 Tax=Peptoniphilus sp. TaxID=1971214 RepID=UPI002A74D693|nr:UvrB/UvrC motif-containing protein [Peptoniphilus sp.]MDY2987530.1 UvrB/UvrC motif-containing protein [Peptoniphilus sp.]